MNNFLICPQKHNCGYLKVPPSETLLMSTHNICFCKKVSYLQLCFYSQVYVVFVSCMQIIYLFAWYIVLLLMSSYQNMHDKSIKKRPHVVNPAL